MKPDCLAKWLLYGCAALQALALVAGLISEGLRRHHDVALLEPPYASIRLLVVVSFVFSSLGAFGALIWGKATGRTVSRIWLAVEGAVFLFVAYFLSRMFLFIFPG